MRHLVEQAGLGHRLRLDSAGTQDWHSGNPADERARKVAAKRGYRFEELRARQVVRSDFETFDLILGMDRSHLVWLEREAPGSAAAQIQLFMSFAGLGAVEEVPDPYYGDLSDYDHALDLIEAGCRGLLEQVRQKL